MTPAPLDETYVRHYLTGKLVLMAYPTNAFTVARRGNSKFVAVIHPEDGHVMTAIGTLPDEHCVKALQTYIVAIHPKLGTVLVHIAALRQVT